ncbi:MAG TPA: ferrochelatase [bacterium]|nr:ferrochelatase [bacterium]HQL62224.1 ferrochelatase [bacterium]
MSGQVAVILVTYGEPEENSLGVHYDYSKRILKRITRKVAPIPDRVVPLIAAWRAVTRYLSWRRHGYRSALNEITIRQGKSLQLSLKEKCPSVEWHVHVARQFIALSLPEMLHIVLGAGADRVIVVPMYVPHSDFTSGLCDEDLETFREKCGGVPDCVKRIDPILYIDKLADVMVEYVTGSMTRRGWDLTGTTGRGLLLGAHGTVVSPAPGIRDSGFADMNALGKLLLARLHPHFDCSSIGWLNHRRGGEWTSPSLETAVREMREKGIKDFIYFPFGFFADNEETLLFARRLFSRFRISNVCYLPCLNDNPAFIELLAAAILSENTVKAARGYCPL